jgi:alanine-synthesizing transaminase
VLLDTVKAMTDFHRIKRLPPYVFEQVNRIKAQARANGADIIDLGMGNPDLDAPRHVIAKLVETAGRPRTDRYSSSKGIAGLRRAQANYYKRRFGVSLNPDTQVVATLGSKEGFANMAQAITAPGDVVLVPNPSYPIHAFGFLMAGGVIRSVPAEPTPAFFPAVEKAMQHSIPKPVAIVVCYPSNPTAYVASLDFYRDLVAFAKRHEIIILSDLAYAEVYFDGEPPPSVLEVPGAIDCTVEFSSLSKTFSMAGWRMGFAVGNERLLAALTRVKSYLDYGAFTPIQVAATAALNGPEDCIVEMRAIYKKRRDALIESFGKNGWKIPTPSASMFAWVPIPEKYQALGSLEFSKLLLEKSDVAVAPGIGFGEHGDNYVRIALVENEQRIRQAARNIRRFFDRLMRAPAGCCGRETGSGKAARIGPMCLSGRRAVRRVVRRRASTCGRYVEFRGSYASFDPCRRAGAHRSRRCLRAQAHRRPRPGARARAGCRLRLRFAPDRAERVLHHLRAAPARAHRGRAREGLRPGASFQDSSVTQVDRGRRALTQRLRHSGHGHHGRVRP